MIAGPGRASSYLGFLHKYSMAMSLVNLEMCGNQRYVREMSAS